MLLLLAAIPTMTMELKKKLKVELLSYIYKQTMHLHSPSEQTNSVAFSPQATYTD
jgi:hypothetical protein